MIARFWHSIFKDMIIVGNIYNESTWERYYVNEINVPFFLLWFFSHTSWGGWRMLIFRRLVFIDTNTNLYGYLPMIWIEHDNRVPNFMIKFSLLMNAKYVTIKIPLSLKSLMELGVIGDK